MSLFDLLFLAVFLATAGAWLAAGAAALGGGTRRAARILRAWAIGFGSYLLFVILASLPGSRHVLGPGEPLCFDDWCLAVSGARHAPAAGAYRVDLRIFSRARRVAQRERNAAVYLEDDRGRRYPPLAGASDVPLDTRLQPGQSVAAPRVFALPGSAHPTGLILRHEGGFPIGWFIAGYETWFRPPTLLRLGN